MTLESAHGKLRVKVVAYFKAERRHLWESSVGV